jgi:hypothetical protein
MKVLWGYSKIKMWVASTVGSLNESGEPNTATDYDFKQDQNEIIDIGEVAVTYNDTNGNTVKHVFGYKPTLRLNLIKNDVISSPSTTDNLTKFMASYLTNYYENKVVIIKPSGYSVDVGVPLRNMRGFLSNIKIENIVSGTKIKGQRLTADFVSRDMLKPDEFNQIFYQDTSDDTWGVVPDYTGVGFDDDTFGVTLT